MRFIISDAYINSYLIFPFATMPCVIFHLLLKVLFSPVRLLFQPSVRSFDWFDISPSVHPCVRTSTGWSVNSSIYPSSRSPIHQHVLKGERSTLVLSLSSFPCINISSFLTTSHERRFYPISAQRWNLTCERLHVYTHRHGQGLTGTHGRGHTDIHFIFIRTSCFSKAFKSDTDK